MVGDIWLMPLKTKRKPNGIWNEEICNLNFLTMSNQY